MGLDYKSKGPLKINKKALEQIATLESSVIIGAAKSYIEADVTIPPNSLSYIVMEHKENFARVNVASNEGGGYYAILKHVYDLWVVIATGQDLPSKATGEKYGMPKGWYSEEY